MAVLRHISGRKGYGDVIRYLTYAHDERAKKILTDENGIRIRRKGILMDGILCDPATFDLDCFEANRKFGKNQGKNEVKWHSYIISFDPRDATDNGLTKEMVQEFGLEFAKEYLPGYQTIVCTHTDGSNGSGNLHCHVVINSLRIKDAERFEYMNQSGDHLAGFKHRCSPKCYRYLASKVMEMCRKRDLYQVDLIGDAKRKITRGEYFVGLRTAKRMLENAGPSDIGQMKKTATMKEELRNDIETCANKADSPEMFKQLMTYLFGITVKESRDRYTFLIPGRERGFTARQLGSDYGKDFLAKVIRGEERFPERGKPYYYRAAYERSGIGKITDVSKNEKAKESPGYAYRIKLSNLQKLAASVNLLSEWKIEDEKEISMHIEAAADVLQENQDFLKAVESRMTELFDLMENLETYERLKPITAALKDAKHSEEYRKTHEKDLMIFRRAKERLKARYPLNDLPSAKKLKKEYDNLSGQRNTLYEERSMIRKGIKDLENAKYNLQAALSKERTKELVL